MVPPSVHVGIERAIGKDVNAVECARHARAANGERGCGPDECFPKAEECHGLGPWVLVVHETGHVQLSYKVLRAMLRNFFSAILIHMPNVTANGIQIEYDTFGDSAANASRAAVAVAV